MKKNPDKNFESLKVDPVTGEYLIVIPEWIVNELEWYEDSQINIILDGNEVVLKEQD